MKKWSALGATAAILSVGAVVDSGVLGIRAESIRNDAGDVTLAGTLAGSKP